MLSILSIFQIYRAVPSVFGHAGAPLTAVPFWGSLSQQWQLAHMSASGGWVLRASSEGPQSVCAAHACTLSLLRSFPELCLTSENLVDICKPWAQSPQSSETAGLCLAALPSVADSLPRQRDGHLPFSGGHCPASQEPADQPCLGYPPFLLAVYKGKINAVPMSL